MTDDILRCSEPMEMTFTVDDATMAKLVEAFEHVNVPECPWFDVQDRQGNKARYYRETVGHWVPIDDEPHEEYECDRCGYISEATFGPGGVTGNMHKYCPNCGARMDG